MNAIVAGGGPVGIFTAIALARRGHDVTVVDRDPGPRPDGTWERAGVMQFMHPHAYRPAVRLALRAEMPDVYDALIAAGAVAALPPGLPEPATILHCRRSVFETTLRDCIAREPSVRWVTGHADRVVVDEDGTVRGLTVDGTTADADLVVVATGRASRLGEELRGPVEGGSCGFSYVSRMYRVRKGQQPCDLVLPAFVTGPGYISLVMPQDAGTHSLLLCYPSHIREFAALRTNDGFAQAAAMVPNLAPWSDPERFQAITDALVGGHLTNTFRLQGPTLGLPPARGLFFLGDTVSTTNPAAGRNLALSLGLAQHFLQLLDETASSTDSVSLGLDEWAERQIRPWYEDHVRWDESLLREFDGLDVDLGRRIPSDVICAAAGVDPSIGPFAGQYLGMSGGPDVLDPVEDRVRAMLRDGWRPFRPGPSGQQLIDAVVTAA